MNNLKIGILGASGFVGQALSKCLIDNKNIELHLFSRDFTTKINNRIHYHKFDLKNKQSKFPKQLLELDIIYYLISNNIPATSWGKVDEDIQHNLLPFVNLIETLINGKLKKIIFTSSAGTVYGTSIKKIDEDSITNPYSPHGISKLACEKYLNYFHQKNGINFEIYRISNIYGPGQNTSKGLGIINTILENYLKNKPTDIYGNGEAIRNYIYIDDVINILAKSVSNNIDESLVLNLASNDNISIRDLIINIEKIIGSSIKINNLPKRISDNPNISIDNTKILNHFSGFQFNTLTSGIEKTFKYLLNSDFKNL